MARSPYTTLTDSAQPHPRLGRFISELEAKLAADEGVSRKRRRSCLVLFEELQAAGYEGGYDSVRRYAKKWRAGHRRLALPVFIPLSFAPGQAFQFDWSEDFAELSGVTVKVNVSHLETIARQSRRYCTLTS